MRTIRITATTEDGILLDSVEIDTTAETLSILEGYDTRAEDHLHLGRDNPADHADEPTRIGDDAEAITAEQEANAEDQNA